VFSVAEFFFVSLRVLRGFRIHSELGDGQTQIRIGNIPQEIVGFAPFVQYPGG
jgi:hypothetical protein